MQNAPAPGRRTLVRSAILQPRTPGSLRDCVIARLEARGVRLPRAWSAYYTDELQRLLIDAGPVLTALTVEQVAS